MKKFLISILFLTTLGLGIWFFWPFFELKDIAIITTKITEIKEKEIFTPPPLIAPEKEEDSQVILTQQGIIEWTNKKREKYDFVLLKENSKLNIMAQAKVDDMFKYQYFAHESPLGKEVGDLANDFNYEFLAIGENLAMGNFSSDEDLVGAWMASPGHRENILSKTYQEIGVAVKIGTFDGKLVWLAVQHFGLPLIACPQPSEIVKLEIEETKEELKEIEEILSNLRLEMQKIRPKWSSDYQQKAKEYNNLVEEYNNLLSENKKLIEQYNKQVQEYNQCLIELK